MKERPIIFSGEMVRAILDGRKTQTRRVIKPQPDYAILKEGTELEAHKCPQLAPVHSGRKEWGLYRVPYHGRDVPCFSFDCPYGKPGDRLWVRETWARFKGNVFYKQEGSNNHLIEKTVGWTPSIYMPRWASGIALEITSIRVERIQEITPIDALAEGIEYERYGQGLGDACDEVRILQTFQELWDSINAKRGYGWYENPWVWVIEFKVI